MTIACLTGLREEGKDVTNDDFLFVGGHVDEYITVERRIINFHNHKGILSMALQFAHFVELNPNENFIPHVLFMRNTVLVILFVSCIGNLLFVMLNS